MVAFLRFSCRQITGSHGDLADGRPATYLMPWPGPQATRSIQMWEFPGPMEMQSSPVLILASYTDTWLDMWRWMPSVLGLSAGASTVTPRTVTPWHCSTTRWNSSLSTDRTPATTTSLEFAIVSDCDQATY